MALSENTKSLLTTIAENVPKVKQQGYDEGHEVGFSEGKNEIFNFMRKDFLTTSKVELDHIFYNWDWEYMWLPVQLQSSQKGHLAYAFYANNYLKKIEAKYIQGSGIDNTTNATSTTSGNSYFAYMCGDVTEIEDVNFSCGSYYRAFYSCYDLVSIAKINSCESTRFDYAFADDKSLTHVRFDGVIGKSIDFKSCPLDIESIKDVIIHLNSYAGTSSGTYTLTLKDTCKTALQADTETVEFDGVSYTYFELITAKGWNLA